MSATVAPPPEVALDKRRRLWTREEYERAGELGLFGPDERLELIGGEVITKVTPQATPHAVAIGLVEHELRRAFPRGYWVRLQAPMALGEDSEPEPDLCVVKGRPRDYLDGHPRAATLIVEVSDSSLRLDRGLKASLYARSGIADYWILNIPNRLLEVHREPVALEDQPFGYHYRSIVRLTAAESIAPLAAPRRLIAVRDLLPAP